MERRYQTGETWRASRADGKAVERAVRAERKKIDFAYMIASFVGSETYFCCW